MNDLVGKQFYLNGILMEVTDQASFDQWVAVRPVAGGEASQRGVFEVRQLVAEKPYTTQDRMERVATLVRLLYCHYREEKLRRLLHEGIELYLRTTFNGEWTETHADHQTAITTALHILENDIEEWADSLPHSGDERFHIEEWWNSRTREDFIDVARELFQSGTDIEVVKRTLRRAYDAVAREYGD